MNADEARPPAFTDEALALRFAEQARRQASLRRSMGTVAHVGRNTLAVRRHVGGIRFGARDLPHRIGRMQQGKHCSSISVRQNGGSRRAIGPV